MTTQTSQTFFALLSLFVAVTTAAVVLFAAYNLVKRGAAGRGVLRFLRERGASVVAAVTGTATLGSLYYSEVVGYIPCELCWYQRIFMYSLAVTSTVAAVKRETRSFAPYGVALALPGLAISIYHTWLQAFPRETSFCSTEAPCAERHIWEFGFVSLPFMAMTAFAFTLVVLGVALLGDRLSADQEPVG